MRGPGGSVRQEPREVHQYMPLCGARGVEGGGQQARNPGCSQIYAFVWGPGGGPPKVSWPVLPSNNGILPSNNGILPSNNGVLPSNNCFCP